MPLLARSGGDEGTMIKALHSHAVERPWGRLSLPGAFASMTAGDAPIGEIWFEDPAGTASGLLVKYLFTAERLSIQVHPGDEAARAVGLASGKDEAWLVVDADPGATIGLGLVRAVSPETLRAAALDGSIEQLVDWRPVRAGDFFYSPAGTIHAIGGGVSLVEIQQDSDVTYRLYDYGRPRPLHLDQGMAVANPGPYRPGPGPVDLGDGRQRLAAGGAFVVERWRDGGRIDAASGEVVVVPLGELRIDGEPAREGSVWSVRGQAEIVGGDALLAYASRSEPGA